MTELPLEKVSISQNFGTDIYIYGNGETNLCREEQDCFAIFMLHSRDRNVIQLWNIFLHLACWVGVEVRADGFSDVSKHYS